MPSTAIIKINLNPIRLSGSLWKDEKESTQ
jgi:hypothetical protein